MILKYEITKEGQLVKEFLKEKNLSRNLLRHLKSNGHIRINGQDAKNYFPLQKGDILEIEINEEINSSFVKGKNDLDILYEDDSFLIVCKEAGVAIQPSRKHFEDSLFASIKAYYEEKSINANIHIVTRLDLSTSGIVLIAKSGYVHSLVNDIEFTKEYMLICHNKFEELKGKYCEKIARDKDSTIKRKVDENGKEASTLYEVISNTDNPLVKCTLLTGRTHQIRVHMAYHNHPLVGDKLYGCDNEQELKLHCYHLAFVSPIDNKRIDILSYPKWLKEYDNIEF